MREQMRTVDVEKRFDAVFGRYINNLPMYLDFHRSNKNVEIFMCTDKSLPYPEWKSLFTYPIDLTKTVEENIKDISVKLMDAYPQMIEVSIAYREPTAREMKEFEKKRTVDELLTSKVKVATTRVHTITRVDLRRDRLYLQSYVEDDFGNRIEDEETQVYRCKRPVSFLMGMIIKEADQEKRFKIFSANTIYLESFVPRQTRNRTFAWDGSNSETQGDS